jgi:hypothetical protein
MCDRNDRLTDKRPITSTPTTTDYDYDVEMLGDQGWTRATAVSRRGARQTEAADVVIVLVVVLVLVIVR